MIKCRLSKCNNNIIDTRKFCCVEHYFEWLSTSDAFSCQSEAGKKAHQLHPELRNKVGVRFFREYIKRNPEHQRIAGSHGGRRNAQLHPELGQKALLNLIKWRNENPEIASSVSSRNGTICGRNNVINGHIFRIQEMNTRMHRVYHEDHSHLSPDENQYCINHVWSKYEHNLIHVNVYFKWKTQDACIIDWVIGIKGVIFDSEDTSTWSKVIEHHKVRTWEGETTEEYKTKRINKLRSLGVTCEIEMICF